MKQKPRFELINLHSFVIDQLQARKGEWGGISAGADVPYFTLAKIASRTTSDPRISTVQKLADFLAKTPAHTHPHQTNSSAA